MKLYNKKPKKVAAQPAAGIYLSLRLKREDAGFLVSLPEKRVLKKDKSMKFPVSTKPTLWGAVAGVIVGMALMSYGFGYVSPGSAEKIAQQRADTAVVAILAPECAAKFRALPDYLTKRVALEKAAGYQRSDLIPKELITLPGKGYADSDLVTACAAEILKEKAA